MNWRGGTWRRGRIDYVEIKVIEIATDDVIWQSIRYPMPSETLPRYREVEQESIVWAPDSKSVTINVGGNVGTTWSVP